MLTFTKFLQHGQRSGNINRFVSFWDRLEWLTIQVYEGQIDVHEAEVEVAQVWPWQRQNYGRGQDEL